LAKNKDFQFFPKMLILPVKLLFGFFCDFLTKSALISLKMTWIFGTAFFKKVSTSSVNTDKKVSTDFLLFFDKKVIFLIYYISTKSEPLDLTFTSTKCFLWQVSHVLLTFFIKICYFFVKKSLFIHRRIFYFFLIFFGIFFHRITWTFLCQCRTKTWTFWIWCFLTLTFCCEKIMRNFVIFRKEISQNSRKKFTKIILKIYEKTKRAFFVKKTLCFFRKKFLYFFLIFFG